MASLRRRRLRLVRLMEPACTMAGRTSPDDGLSERQSARETRRGGFGGGRSYGEHVAADFRRPLHRAAGGGRDIRERLGCAAAIFNSFNSQEEDGTIRCLFLISGRAGARQRQLRLRCRRHGVPRPLRRPCRHFDRPCASALRADDLGAGRTAGILLQFGGKLVAAHAGRAAGSIVGLRRLPAFPLQLGRRSQ